MMRNIFNTRCLPFFWLSLTLYCFFWLLEQFDSALPQHSSPCGLSFRIAGDSHREDKKRGRSHSFHFLTEGNEHILEEWKTKGRHRGDGWLLCVYWKPRQSRNLQTPSEGPVSRPQGVHICILHPTNTSICSLKSGEGEVGTGYIYYGRFGVVIYVLGNYLALWIVNFYEQTDAQRSRHGSITVETAGKSNKLRLHQNKFILEVTAWK